MRNPEYPALPPGRSRMPLLLLLVGVALLEFLLCRNAADQERLCATTGLRFADALSEQEIQRAIALQSEPENLDALYASFWGQSNQTVKGENGRTEEGVICISFYGEASDCLPAQYLCGGAPGSAGKTCSVSESLAQTVFGSIQVDGLKINLLGDLYEITGVFSAKDKVLLFPSMQYLTCAELRGLSGDTPKADAENWCVAVGLPAPQWIRYGPQRVMLARSLCWLPLILTAAVLLGTGIFISTSWKGIMRGVLWFFLVLGAALMLPVLLQALPGWLVPTQWSDFAFWPELLEKVRQNGTARQMAIHYWRDYGRY